MGGKRNPSRWSLRGRVVLLGSVIALLVGIVGVALQLETSRQSTVLSAPNAMRLCIASYFCGRRVRRRNRHQAWRVRPSLRR